jgi:ribosome-associated translation inhibitor RaiA
MLEQDRVEGPGDHGPVALPGPDRREQGVGMRSTQEQRTTPDTVVELRGGIADDLVEYTRTKVGAVLTRAGGPVHRSRVRVIRHADPARERPVEAQAHIDLGGKPVVVHVDATKPREAVDLLVDRLAHRLEKAVPDRHHKRGTRGGPADVAAEEPEIVRHRTPSAGPCTVAEAVAELDDLGLDFHLFVEASLGVDAVVHRDGVTAVRLALADGRADRVEGAAATSASSVPAPVLSVPEAVEHLRLTGLAFVFFVDADRKRGCVLHHRHDGGYGLVEPAESG